MPIIPTLRETEAGRSQVGVPPKKLSEAVSKRGSRRKGNAAQQQRVPGLTVTSQIGLA